METCSRTKMRAVLGERRFMRWGHLAFAYGIGMPYRRVEYKTRQHNEPKAMYIAGTLYPELSREELQAKCEEIENWLAVPVDPAWQARMEERRAAALKDKVRRTALHQAGRLGKAESFPEGA